MVKMFQAERGLLMIWNKEKGSSVARKRVLRYSCAGVSVLMRRLFVGKLIEC